MKTKEEILNKIIGEIRAEYRAEIWYDDAIKAMEEYAQQQLKILNIPVTMQRSELLIAFKDWENENYSLTSRISSKDRIIDYLSNL